MKNRKKAAKNLHIISVTILLVVAAFWFVFALLSGSEEYGGGIIGIMKNSPNAIPWLILFGAVYCAWRWRLVGAR